MSSAASTGHEPKLERKLDAEEDGGEGSGQVTELENILPDEPKDVIDWTHSKKKTKAHDLKRQISL